MTLQFYKELFNADSSKGGNFIIGCFSSTDTRTREELGKDVTMQETRWVLRDMASYKALGPDGFQAIFFKKT